MSEECITASTYASWGLEMEFLLRAKSLWERLQPETLVVLMGLPFLRDPEQNCSHRVLFKTLKRRKPGKSEPWTTANERRPEIGASGFHE